MRFDDDARFYVTWDAELNFDPTNATVTLEIGTDPVTVAAASWQGAPVLSGGVWRRTARTDAMVAGSSAGQSGDIRPAKGRYISQFILVSSDGQRIPATSFTIDVR